MDLKLLLIATNGFPSHLIEHMNDYGFITTEARGRLKIKSLLSKELFNAIVWCNGRYEPSLADDLLEILNQRASLPLILLTENFESPLIATKIQGPFGLLDITEEPATLLKAIEYACSQPEEKNNLFQEIDFKNLVHHVTQNQAQPSQEQPQTLKLHGAWLAVDRDEKRLLSSQDTPPLGVWRKIAQWLCT